MTAMPLVDIEHDIFLATEIVLIEVREDDGELLVHIRHREEPFRYTFDDGELARAAQVDAVRAWRAGLGL